MNAARTTLAPVPASIVKPASATMMATERERRDMPAALSRPPMTAADQADVPAADGHDVAQAGRGEAVRDLTRDPVATAHEDARGQTRHRFRQHPGQRLVGRVPDPLRDAEWVGGRLDHADGGDAGWSPRCGCR